MIELTLGLLLVSCVLLRVFYVLFSFLSWLANWDKDDRW